MRSSPGPWRQWVFKPGIWRAVAALLFHPRSTARDGWGIISGLNLFAPDSAGLRGSILEESNHEIHCPRIAVLRAHRSGRAHRGGAGAWRYVRVSRDQRV